MSWESKTGQFDSQEMARLESESADELRPMLEAADPVVALRALTEIRLNGASEKLQLLLSNVMLNNWWSVYFNDAGVTSADHRYAAELRACLPR